MFINPLRDKLLIDTCCTDSNAGIIEITNSEREKELKKVWVDCSSADHSAFINLEAKKNSSLCPLFRQPGIHLKVCDGILLLEKNGNYHAVFCELKTSWNAGALKQIQNSHIFFEFAHSLAKIWHGAADVDITSWFAILTTGRLPVQKFGTSYRSSSIPNASRPSKKVEYPRRLQLKESRGLLARDPLPISELAIF